jgi:pimeloyl-[acyl-carrier protein] methyl ester esterase
VKRLHVRIEGHGRDVLLLHGWGFHSGAWDMVAAQLASRHRVHRIDLPGHGGSHGHPVPDFDAAVSEVALCVPDGSVVVGWSLGGLFAQRLAARSTARIAGLVLVGATPCFVARDDWRDAMDLAVLESFARELESDTARTLEQFVYLNALGAGGSRAMVRAMLERLKQAPAATPAALRDGLRWLRETDLRASSAQLETPCVVVHGARDRITPVGAGRWLARAIRGARLVELEDAAHLPFATHPQRFIEAVEMLDG